MLNKKIILIVFSIAVLILPGTVYATFVKFGYKCGNEMCPGECKYDGNAYYDGKPCSSYGTSNYYSGGCVYLDNCLFNFKAMGTNGKYISNVYGDMLMTFQTSFQLSSVQSGYTLTPKAENVLNSDDALNVQVFSVGEYFEPGGSGDSPPIFFNQPIPNYSLAPQINGGNCGKIYTKFDCNTSSTLTFNSLSTGNATSFSLENGNSFSQNSFSLSSLTPDDYNLTVERTYDCALSGYGQYCPADRPGQMQIKADEEWYSINVGVSSAGTCTGGAQCNTGFICCQDICRDPSKGICRDISGNGIPVWIPYS